MFGKMRFQADAGRMAAAIMVMAAICSAPGAADNLQDMSDELVANLTEYLEKANLSFFDNSTPVDQVVLPSYQPFDPKGMGMLYNITPLVLDAVVKKDDFLPEGLVSISDGHVEFDPNVSWQTLVVHYLGPISFVFFFIIFGLMLPIAGLFWCCCHMCRVGRRRRPFDRKQDSCLRGVLAILLIALLTMFLFGVVCTFATEQQVEDGVSSLPDELHNGTGTLRQLLNTTAMGVQLKINKFSNFSQQGIAAIFQGISINLKGPSRLGVFNAAAVTSLTQMVDQLDSVQAELRSVQQTTSTLRFQAGQLNSGLRKVKRNLLQTLASCDMPACVNLQRKHRIGELNTDIQYSQMLDKYFPTMPDVTDLLNNVTALIDSNIKEEVAEGQRVFRDIQTNIQRTLDQQLPRARSVYSSINKDLESVVRSVERHVRAADSALARAQQRVSAPAAAAAAAARYRRYAGLALASSLLLITLVVAWGLLCGVCGKRPDVYGASDCCNKGAGARGLYCGMVLMFLLGGVFCVFCVAYFLLGAGAQRTLCDPLRDPMNNKIFQLVDKFVNIEQEVFKAKANESSGFNVSSLIVRCHRNDTLYDMFQVSRILNSSQTTREQIELELALRSAELTPVFPTARVVILKDSAKRKLRLLADCGLSDFQFDRILSALETNMTSLELPALARTLQRAAQSADARAGYGAVPQQLRAAAAQLADLHQDIVTPMLRHTAALNQTVNKLRDTLRFNQTSLREAVSSLLHSTAQAEEFLNEKGEETVRQLVETVTKFVAKNAMEALDSFMSPSLLGRCAALSAAYNRTADAVCVRLLRPVNGFWLSVGYCALLLVPLLLVSAKLARLYLQVDPYPGPLVEASEYEPMCAARGWWR
ncbi:prominin-like protein isoform X4 [Plodia interpunctella]|uniref:prominin-like protein isoform X4 n=1 Tax=Plodia interpunctella TaxID=58824 RepID=UPI002367429B|nr:prominin-like protein isoform X5 [Plodia interpunctella]